MEAIERFINVTEVSNPKLVVVVGSLGLASNLVGLLLFHDHGHAHGGHSHSHGGHSHGAHSHSHSHSQAHSHSASDDEHATGDTAKPVQVGRKNVGSSSNTSEADTDATVAAASAPKSNAAKRRPRQDSVGSLYGHPAQTRAFVVQTAHELGYDSPAKASSSAAGERARLLGSGGADYGSTSADDHDHEHDVEAGTPVKKAKKGAARLFGKGQDHADHEGHAHSDSNHGHSHGGHSHGHGEGSMNMRGVFLHVLGDALGNVGVIAAGLFIMLSDAPWRFYSDPLISFLITIIIFHSALPLVKSASFILLQAVPTSVSLEEVREAIKSVEGVINLHELHVWQLSESKIVASVHVLVDCSSNQNEKYMEIAAQIRNELHHWGIHSSTIQPEFVPGGLREAALISGVEVAQNETDEHGRLITTDGQLVENEVGNADTACLIACGTDDSCKGASCCPPPKTSGAATPRRPSSSRSGHSH